MELKLQFGYGMMDHSRVLIKAWGGGTVILSPRDLSPKQLERLAKDITSHANGKVLLDPQFYLPHTDHERLISHDYWPSQYSTNGFWFGVELRELLKKLVSLNDALCSEAIVLPGLYAEKIDDDWLAQQKIIIDEARNLTDLPLFTTIALGADTVKSDEDIDEIHAVIDDWDVTGIYLVCEHPIGKYLVTDPNWLANVLDLVAGLRLKGKEVLVGYCNHQMLPLACVCANWMASGTWMNVRSFPPDKFRIPYEDEIKQRAVWYYCPQALSEYKVPFLDIAKKKEVLALMSPPPSLSNSYADVLFSGVQPTTLGWTEQNAFRHYLSSLYSQVRSARKDTFNETVDYHERLLNEAKELLMILHEAGVRGQHRDFLQTEAIDASLAALSVIRTSRGPMLRRKWSIM